MFRSVEGWDVGVKRNGSWLLWYGKEDSCV